MAKGKTIKKVQVSEYDYTEKTCDICGKDASGLPACSICKKDICREHLILVGDGIRVMIGEFPEPRIGSGAYCQSCLLLEISHIFLVKPFVKEC